MKTTNKVSQVVGKQLPQFIEDDNSLFGKLIEYYYKSQEKTGYGQNILNDFLQYLNIDELNVDILGGKTKIVEDVSATDTEIVVENVDSFLDKNGSVLINNEVIFYEEAIPSPSVALSPGISYDQIKVKWTTLANPINDFNGTERTFSLLSQQNPVTPSSAQHLIVKVYGKVLIPNVDYNVESSNIVFTNAPRAKTVADDSVDTSITFLEGFSENSILVLDDISETFGDNRTTFNITRNSAPYQPVVDEYIIAIYDGQILTPKIDFTFDLTTITFNFIPLIGRRLDLFSIEAAIPSFGTGAIGFSRVDDLGQLSSIQIDQTGSDYRFEYPPKVSIKSKSGSNASAIPLINGIKNIQLLSGGKGYSTTNPPTVNIQDPTKIGGTTAKISAKVVDGSVSELVVEDSGSGYTFVPRVTFIQPGGAKLAAPTIVNGSISGDVQVTNKGQGYTTAPTVYIDEPTGDNPIKASLVAVLDDDGSILRIDTLNAGQGYETVPRIAIIDPVGAQILETKVDSDGRVIDIELLSGGSGYDDIPSVYIVDDRVNDVGASIGGTGAKASAAIFNGQITDINVTSFGSGYSQSNPPKIVIQSPPNASASVEIGLGEVTGFKVISKGSGYSKCKFSGCARAASGIKGYTTGGEVVFSGETTAQSHSTDSEIKCLDELFVKRLLDKYTEQYLPDVPSLDYESIDVRTAIKNIKTFYSTKGTSFSVAYLFKLLYGEDVSISYPKDQIIKPSSATWSVNTILRATLESGDPTKIKDALVQQFESITDPNVQNASALVENYISIKTSDVEIFELVLSEETITGNFIVPYKTKLVEGLSETSGVITVDSTIGWPERNGEFVIAGSEVVRYKEKSLNQFIECTRGVDSNAQVWDAASEVKSNFKIYINKDTADEVVLNIVGIVDAQQTTLSDTGSYYLPGDKLSVSKLGGTTTLPQLTDWLYNVKKLIEIDSITYGGVNNQSATVTCSAPHGLLVGDQVTIYGANPIIYNGTFLVTSRDSPTVFQYVLPQPATVNPQGNILISVDLNKGKSTDVAIQNIISLYTTNVQNSFFNDEYVYVASTGIPNYNIGPFVGSALLPGNQRKLNRFPLSTQTISTKTTIIPGSIGTWINGVSAWSYKSTQKKTFGAVTSIDIKNSGLNYDAERPPVITVSGGGGSGAQAEVVVDGSLTEIEVTAGGSGYTSSPLVSIVGGGGSGASATAIVTKGVVSRILVNNGGVGYTSKPSITIVGGGGTGAQGNASVRGPVKSVSITSGGSSYTSKPEVTLSSGSGAVAQAIVSNGRIISIAIISGGSGYTTAPEISISGDGFGAVAKATIDLDGENAGKVTSIEITNRGIGYTQGLTEILLTSVGDGAVFDSNVFEWTYNLEETTEKDSAKGFIFEGINNQYGGEYAHVSNPQRLRYILGDNLILNDNDQIVEQETQIEHSPIIGWAFDGNPIYGPYSYEDPTDQGSNVIRMRSSYALKTNLVYNEITNPTPSRVDGPLLADDAAGKFVDDYEYNFGSGDLDQYNGRFCKTPDFPNGRYCYFVTIDATESGNPVFPYILGPDYNSIVDTWNLSTSSIQQNIPTGVVRYRDPYENVDIDVERIPNASSNALTTEDGFILLFDPEDENRDGVISQDEIDDPEQLFEESPLQLYDYFPKVRFDSKVDIEVQTIEKFEDASVSGFIIENPGQNYQVNDILVFDNTDTDGTGISARISRIKGEEVQSYTYETVESISYGILTTTVPHNIVTGDRVFVDYTPIMDNTNKTFTARQYKGVEEIVVTQNGSGYNVDIPPVITIDGDGENAVIEAKLTSVGSISEFDIINSGHGFTNNPRILSSHPQIFKKANYYTTLFSNNDYVKINDIVVTESKEVILCGKTLDAQGDTVGFVSKISALGIKEWEKTLESSLPSGTTYLEFEKLLVDGNDIYVVGNNRPNQAIQDSYNPDIIFVKYVQSADGLDATLSFQKAYSGISGSTREDNVTSLIKLTNERFVIGGFTNTNSSNPHDAFVAVLDTAGTFVIKRKFATDSDSEKIVDLLENNGHLYFLMEVADTATSNDISLVLGKATVSTTLVTTNYLNKVSNSAYSFIDSSFTIDEYNELYVTATLRQKTNNTTKDSFWVGKFDVDADLIWNYRYAAPSRDINVVNTTAIDIFGNLNVAYTEENITTGQLTASSVKIDYKGKIVNHTTNKFNTSTTTDNNIEGITATTIDVDNSGDVYVFGQTSINRNEFVFDFSQTDTATDKTAHYTANLQGNDATDALALVGDGVAKLFAKDVANPSTWTNANINIAGSSLGSVFANNWTLEFMLYKDATNSATFSQTQQTLISIGDATDSTGGLWMYYDMSSGRLELLVTNNATSINSGSGVLQSTQTNMFADDSWQFISLTKSANTFTAYVNGTQVFTGSITNTSLGSKNFYLGQIAGRDGTAGTFRSNEQGQFYVDNLRLRNIAVTPTVPTDVTTLPPAASFGLAYDWTDDAWFTDQTARYDYVDHIGFGLKVDKDADSVRIGDQGVLTSTDVSYERVNVTPVTGNSLTISNVSFELGASGLQSLDYNEANTGHTNANGSSTVSVDIWSSRNATIPAPGSQKVQASAVVKNRYFFKQADTIKIDNIQRLTLNQSFNVTVGSKLVLNDGSTFVNSGYVTSVDKTNRYVFVAINNNPWNNDLTTGQLSTERFDEQETYGVKGPLVNDINEIVAYEFSEVVNTTPGTFNIDLSDYDAPEDIGGTNNLDEYGKFKEYGPSVYRIRILETSGTSTYIPGSVVEVPTGNITFNTAKSTIQITGLTAVTKIDLITDLEKILQVTAVSNSDTVYVITGDSHYLNQGNVIYVDGNPTTQSGGVVYDEYNGSFTVDTVISVKEFTYKLKNTAVGLPATTPGNVSVFAKSPIIKMYYGHQYIFDVSHSSMLGGNLSFSKDSLNKLEYSFNSIERIGTPGVTGEGQPTPSVKLKVDNDIVTNISYYFDPSRTGANSPIDPNSFLDIVPSPYIGVFTVESTSGGTITRGDDTFRFVLDTEPEGDAERLNTTYTTSSEKAVGSIGDIRIVNNGGFYTKLPKITGINSSRKIERVQINEPGTEYAVGTYNSVPILGDGEGGFVEIKVENTTDDEGITTPGQITEVKVTSPGKGYTTASIDIQAIDGILGSGLAGSGADLEVVIPPFGTGASIFTKGTNVGKIKKLNNNNFGYDYPHDYTLRPEITFPINAQLINTSILESITITDPGSGYTQAPVVTLTGGGGSNAIAEATIKNGRLDTIIVKDPGSGYSTEPKVELKSSFNYVVNLDLGLLQFAFPHGIPNGAEVTLNVVDTGDGAGFPVASGAVGTLNGTNTYYAITGAANSLDDDQMKLAITASNAELGDAISFINAGVGRQQVLTSSFGGQATANVGTSIFLEGELIYQGDSLETATATGYVSTNNGWQVGARIIKIVNYDGEFNLNQKITGTISKSSGIIGDLKIAKGVLEIGPITKTTGQFVDDVGKPSEIIQKIQDSYYYQDFSYAINSSVSIEEWKNTVIKNVHPASFKVFGQLEIQDSAEIPNKETSFELTKSVELTRDAVVPNIQNFALAEPIYQEFDNTEVLFRQKRLTSSENILTSVVQRLDDISNLFDGERTQFPMTVDGETVIANSNQLMIVLNGVVQTPEESFEVLNDSIVFAEPPQPVALVKYVSVGIEQIQTSLFTVTNTSGIFPPVGNYLVGVASSARARVVSTAGDTITAFITEGTFSTGELVTSNATGFSANLVSVSAIPNIGLFRYGENIRNIQGDTAKVERINLASGQETPLADTRFNIGLNTTSFDVVAITDDGSEVPVAAGVFEVGENYQIASEIVTVTDISQGTQATTLTVTRAQLGTSSVGHLAGTPIYGTQIEVTNTLLLSKTTGTYQSTPGLFDIQLNDTIIAAGSGVVARITSTTPYQDPVTQQFVDTVEISEGSSFSGLLFNRITSQAYPNIILDNLSQSQVNIVSFDNYESNTLFNSKFPNNEIINNYTIKYVSETGAFTEGEFVRNYKLDYGNVYGQFLQNDEARVRKLSLTGEVGEGFFARGQIIRSENTKAEVLGYNRATDIVYLGKMGRSQANGEDYHKATFVQGAQINTYNEKFGTGCLALSKGTSAHTFVSGVTDAITAGSGATGSFTAATGTTYDPISGVMVIEIGSHSLTTSNTVTISDDGVTFTCSSDNNTNNYSYPRSGDPASGSNLAISAVTATTITVNVGAVPVDEYLTIPTSTEFGFGTNDFTVELWIKPNSVASGTKMLVDFRPTGSDTAANLYLSGSTVAFQSANGAGSITGSTNLVANTWYHVAVVRESGVTKLYLNGAQEGSNLTDTTDYGSTRPIKIGANLNGTAAFPGYIDELRISTTARYTGAFTAPTGINQGDTNTVLLLHFDGENGQVYTEDWSGEQNWTNGHEFNNDAILATSRSSASTPGGFTGNSHRYLDAAKLLQSNKEFLAQEIRYLIQPNLPTELATTAPKYVLNAPDYNNGDLFSWSVAHGNGKFVIGAQEDDDASNSIYNSGSVYVYSDAGVYETRIVASDKADSDRFGYSVAVGGNKIAVGAPYNDDGGDGSGCIYTYNLDGTGENKIVASDDAASDNFGISVAMTGTYIFVGAPGESSGEGAVYRFDLDGTNQVKIVASDGAADDNFGYSVAIDEQNNKIIVGAYNDDDNGNNSGSVYVYNLDGTGEVKITAGSSNGAADDNFGTSVDAYNNLIVIGANGDGPGGSAYLYQNDGTFVAKIVASDATTGDNFGVQVAVNSTAVFVAASGGDERSLSSTGTIYKFDRDGTNQVKLTETSTAANSQLGLSTLFANGNYVMAGSRDAVNNQSQAGRAYIWKYESVAANYDYAQEVRTTIDSLTSDLNNGSNNHMWDFAATSVNRDATPITTTRFSGEESLQLQTYQYVNSYSQNIINNVLVTVTGSHGLTQTTDTTITDSSYSTLTTYTPSAAVYTASTGTLQLTIGSHSLTTSDRIGIAIDSLTFTCTKDGNASNHSYPRATDPAANAVLAITAADATTITVNVGASGPQDQYAHTFVSAASNAVTVLNYTSADCADVKTTIDNLVSIAEDTISNATAGTPVDHLASVTKVSPVYEYLGGVVDSFIEVPITVSLNDAANEVLYTNQIDVDSRSRFKDAASLIRLNRGAIVDKASFDMLTRYPDLATDMPRNVGGSNDGTLRCQTDLGLILDAIAKDLEDGGNENTVRAGRFYLGNNDELIHIRLQVWQSAYAHQRLAYYSKQAITGDLDDSNTNNVIIGDWGITNDAPVNFTPTGATYDPATGVMELTIGAHSLALGRFITIADNSLTFTCSQDGNGSNHTYPRSTDPASGVNLEVIATTATTITVNVGASPAGQQYAHTFVSAASNAVSTAGDCANVKNAIDTLVDDVLNYIISPSDNDYQIAGDRLYFNRDYIAFETIGLTKAAYSYTLGGSTFNSYSFTGENTETQIRSDLEIIMISIISDLQTGGNNSAVDSIAKFITAQLRVTRIEDILGQFVELLKQFKFLGVKALQNYLFGFSESVTPPNEYQAQYNTIPAYRDSETITNTNSVVSRFEDLIDSIILIFTPSGDTGVSASKNILFNEGYYKNEISSIVNTQFGSGSWTFEQFLDDLITDIEHDVIITDTSSSNTTQAQKVSLLREGVINTINFNGGAGYDSAPTVTIDAPGAGGIQATAEAVLSDSAVLTSIDITAAGSGYTANGNYSFSGSGFTGTHGGYLEQTSGGITNVTYDGEFVDFRSSTPSGEFTFSPAAAIVSNGTGSGSTGGFNVGYEHVKFGAGTGSYPQRQVQVNKQFNASGAGYDTLRVYVIAGSGSNGGEAPDTDEDLGLYISVDNGPLNFRGRLVYGGSSNEGGANNYTNFTSLTAVDVPLLESEKESSNVKVTIRQMQHSSSSSDDHYGITRVSMFSNGQGGFNAVGNTISVNFGVADSQSGTPTTPTLAFNSSRSVIAINITNRGSGYIPSSPPNATIAGGNPTTAATVTNITVVLDSSRFTPGQLLVTSAGGSAIVYEDIGNAVYVGPVTGTALAAGQFLTQGNVTAEIPTNGVSTAFDWYTNVGNIRTFDLARNITSLVEDEGSSTNLVTNPETYVSNSWYESGINTPTNNYSTSPDNTETAIRIRPNTSTGEKLFYRTLNLTSYNTFDDSGVKFDTDALSFDNGPNDENSTQQYTTSYFVKADGYNKIRHYFRPVPFSSNIFIQIDLQTGTIEQTFEVGQPGVLTLDEVGAIPYGNGWYRIYITGTFGYGFTQLRSDIYLLNNAGNIVFAGDNSSGILVWGSKINAGPLDAYTAVNGDVFFSNIEYNIKKYALELLEDYTELALNGTLPNPATNSGSIPVFNSSIASDYNSNSIQRIIRENLKMIKSQLLDSDHYLTVTLVGSVTIPSKTFGERIIPVPLGGGIEGSDFLYGSLSDASSEVQKVTVNEGLVVKDYKRMRITGDITNGPFTMNEIVQKQGDSTVNGVVYGFYEDANYKYVDVAVTGGTWALADIVVGAENGTSAQIDQITNRLQIIDTLGDFETNSIFKGYTSNSTAATEVFYKNDAAVLDNTGGKLVVDTETTRGSFETTSVVYPEESRLYLEVQKYAGFDIGVGDRLVTDGYTRLGISIQNNENQFVVGNFLYKITGGVQDVNNYGIINKVDLPNNYIYVVPVVGGFNNGDVIAHYDITNTRTGFATVSTRINYEGQAAGQVQFIEDVGLNKRLYISNTIGTFAATDSIKSGNGYKAAIIENVELKARVSRYFRGFDGTQTTFDLTINNGDAYFPDPAGHMLIFINGILQPPGASQAFTAFSDKIQFSEPPTLGSSFTGFYVGKLRQLDDISFEFDSLRQSFNLRRNETFYSLTLTDGVQSSTIRPENNIIVSLNGVIQEPGVGFEIVGSRIIFNEIPRVGSTFVAFSYVGSEADVDAAVVVPPIEAGDLIEIQGEVSDREVAVIESSNSLVTFDYLGSVFGKDAAAATGITSGTIRSVSVTSPGSGYTSRPTVRVDSISGFDAQIKALVGVGSVAVNTGGSGYQKAAINVETTVDDDWVAPDLSQYGEEAIDPEIV